jgi:CRISPR/Cas system-associated exonuclease Cas4 (RecB family)
MFEIISSINFIDSAQIASKVKNIHLRGYKTNTFLTGEFALKLKMKEIKPLSVSDISDYFCESRRDLYMKKGKNKPAGIKRDKTWGGIAGNLVEDYFFNLFQSENDKRNRLSYDSITKASLSQNEAFALAKSKQLKSLNSLKSRASEDPEWFLSLLYHAGKQSMAFKSIDSIFAKNNSLPTAKSSDVKKLVIPTKCNQIGISTGVTPDFVLPSHRIVGDIKSGIMGFKDYFLYTCTGYALAYENAYGQGNDIDIGVIFYFPTRSSDFAKPISFAQTYLFVIDDELRGSFIRRRDEAYSIISKDKPPIASESIHCLTCQVKNACKELLMHEKSKS